MPTPRLESGLIGAGNSAGFTSVNAEEQPVSDADATSRLQVPTLLIFSVCVTADPPPQTEVLKTPLPVTFSVPLPSVPVAVKTVVGAPGSLLLIAIVAVWGPTVLGVTGLGGVNGIVES